MKIYQALLAVLFTLVLAACATTQGSTDAPVFNPDAQAMTQYHIGVDDLLEVSVWNNPDLSVKVPVRPDGRITVPLIGDVVAGGKTPDQVSADIKERLKSFIRDPQVAVIVTELRSHEYLLRVRVTGAVRNPVSIPYHQGMTVLDAVLAAGGITEFAAPDRTELYRKTKSTTSSYAVQLGQILQDGKLGTNYPVQPGDTIVIKERWF